MGNIFGSLLRRAVITAGKLFLWISELFQSLNKLILWINELILLIKEFFL